MTEVEISLARAYLAASGQDPIAALVRSVRDIARLRRSAAATHNRDLDGMTAARSPRCWSLAPAPAHK